MVLVAARSPDEEGRGQARFGDGATPLVKDQSPPRQGRILFSAGLVWVQSCADGLERQHTRLFDSAQTVRYNHSNVAAAKSRKCRHRSIRHS